MQKRTIQKILEDVETIDVLKTAEAVLEEKKQDSKEKRAPSVARVLEAWNNKRARIRAEEEFRQSVRKIWNKFRKH